MALIAIKRKQAAAPLVLDEKIEVASDAIGVTRAGAEAVNERVRDEGKPAGVLRVAIMGGGCNGLSYVFSVEDDAKETDHVFTAHGARVVVDPKSLRALGGTVLDYNRELGRKGFVMKNPNASSSCSCGSSFSL